MCHGGYTQGSMYTFIECIIIFVLPLRYITLFSLRFRVWCVRSVCKISAFRGQDIIRVTEVVCFLHAAPHTRLPTIKKSLFQGTVCRSRKPPAGSNLEESFIHSLERIMILRGSVYSLERKFCVLCCANGEFEYTLFVRWDVIYSILSLGFVIYSHTEKRKHISRTTKCPLYQRGDRTFENDCSVAW